MTITLDVVFKNFTNIDFLQKIENGYLIFYDSCQEDVYNDKEFLKLATAGCKKKVNVIYVKHNLYQQSKWSRPIDLNTTHIILFKFLSDLHKIEH